MILDATIALVYLLAQRALVRRFCAFNVIDEFTNIYHVYTMENGTKKTVGWLAKHIRPHCFNT